MNNKFEKYIYIWDTHWGNLLLDFLNENDDWKTFFYFLWDLFDRGYHSARNINKIMELHKNGRCDIILGNHDLFFIFWHSGDIIENFNIVQSYNNQLRWNWGRETLESFREYCSANKKNWLSYDTDYSEYLTKVRDFLLQFKIYWIDHNNNYLVHWGIPIWTNWELWWEVFDINGEWLYLDWIDRIEKLNDDLMGLDEKTLMKFLWTYNSYSDVVVKNTYEYNNLWEWEIYLESTQILPTWYLSRFYLNNEFIQETLSKELKRHWLRWIFVGHDWNEVDNKIFNNKSNKSNHIVPWLYRLDRSNIWSWSLDNFWYATFDKNGECIKLWDVVVDVREKEKKKWFIVK